MWSSEHRSILSHDLIVNLYHRARKRLTQGLECGVIFQNLEHEHEHERSAIHVNTRGPPTRGRAT